VIRECSQLTRLFFLRRSYAFGISFNPAVWNRAETGLKCNTGIKGNHIPWALAYTDSWSYSILAVMCPANSNHKVSQCFSSNTATVACLSALSWRNSMPRSGAGYTARKF